MTDKSNKALSWVSGVVALAAILTFAYRSRAGIGNDQTGDGMLGSLINLVLLLSLLATTILTRKSHGNGQSTTADTLLVLALIAAGLIVGVSSGQRAGINVVMLTMIAFAVGRWRGLKESRPEANAVEFRADSVRT